MISLNDATVHIEAGHRERGYRFRYPSHTTDSPRRVLSFVFPFACRRGNSCSSCYLRSIVASLLHSSALSSTDRETLADRSLITAVAIVSHARRHRPRGNRLRERWTPGKDEVIPCFFPRAPFKLLFHVPDAILM